jgi:hypothetical protein
MGPKSLRCKCPWIAAVGFIVVAGLTVLTSGQQGGRLADPRDSLHVPILTFGPQGPAELAGLPDDWSHHHLVFSNPGTEQDAVQKGTYDEWLRVVNEPRYIMQQLKRRSPAQGPAAEYVARMNEMARVQEAAVGLELAAPQTKQVIRPAPPKRNPLNAKMGRDWSMDLGSGTVGAGQYPAKYGFSTTAEGLCSNSSTPDYVVYNSGKAGVSGSQANIIAYDNIYSGCSSVSGASTTVPLVYWSYYTGTGNAATSPVLSGDGSKVAFIETPTSGAATLRILRWVGGQGTDYNHPTAPQNLYTNTTAGAGSNTAWSTCPSGQSCMISVTFQTELNPDTTSSPWYDYASDTVYVGDSDGYLHKITGAFNGTPGEVTTPPWPVAVQTGYALTGPVFDDSTSLIFVGSSNPSGYLQSVNSSTGAVVTSAQLATSGLGINDAPLVDSVASTVYVVVGDAEYECCVGAVLRFPETFTGTTTYIHQRLGSSSKTTPIYSGTFDNEYYTSANGTGNLWVCGNPGGSPTLYAVPVTSNNLSAAVAGPVVSNATTTCSPATEFCTTTTGVACTTGTDTSTTTNPSQNDYIFVSVRTQSGTAIQSCTADEGCVLSYTIATTPAATYSGAGAFAGGTSGMVVDTQNTTVSGTLQLYFGILGSMSCSGNSSGGSGTGSAGSGTGGCAVQASQAAP